MREIVPGVWSWAWLSPPHGYNFNGYLIAEEGVVVDPVEMTPETEAELRRRDLRVIVLTNRNHVRAAARLRELTGARTLIHPADADYARGQGATLDGDLTAGERLGPFSIVAVPGKSPGEVALHWPERRLLLVGDAVIGNPPGRCSLLRDKVMDDPPQLRASVRRLLDLDFDTLLVADGEPILTSAKQRLRELVGTFSDEVSSP
jgi:glyoxylase-like metal-dependent hydrolase (beta-lactamase superfamily II)